MQKISTRFGICLAVVLFASGAAQAASCELDSKSVVVNWTAYKTTAKTAVGGTFKKLNVTGSTKASDLAKLAKGLKFEVDKTSVDSKNPGRDQTLSDFFFAKLSGGILGQVTHVEASSKQFTLQLQLNGKTVDVPMTYEASGNAFTAHGSIDLMQFAAGDALSSLNQKCFDLHKGADGVSKTWSEVGLVVTGNVNGSCL